MTDIKWCNTLPKSAKMYADGVHLAMFEPEPAFREIAGARKNTNHILCPAVQDFFKNTFIVRSPVDITFNFKDDGEVYVDEFGQDFFDTFVILRYRNGDEVLSFSMEFYYLFMCEDDVMIEQMPACMHDNDFTRNCNIIPGTFNISKWIRPVTVSIELKPFKGQKSVKIKRGDALYYVKFKPKKDDKVSLTRIDYTEDIEDVIRTCTTLKLLTPGNTLQQNYEVAKGYLQAAKHRLFGKKSKCPFHFWSK